MREMKEGPGGQKMEIKNLRQKKPLGLLTCGMSPPTGEKLDSLTLYVTPGRDKYEPLVGDETWQSVLGGLHQVVNVDVDVIVIFNVVYSGLRWDLVDDQARPLQTVICDVLHLFTHKALWLLPGLPVCWQQVFILWRTNTRPVQQERKDKNRKLHVGNKQIQTRPSSFMCCIQSPLVLWIQLKDKTAITLY